MNRGWLLNLHAELERGASADPLRAAREHPGLVARAAGLIPPGDCVVTALTDLACVDTIVAWSPTAAVRALVARAGFEIEHWPPLSIIERVLSRRWNAERLGLPLPGASLVLDRADLARATAIESPTGSLLLRKMRGFAGKGRRICRVGALAEADLRFANKALEEGGLLVEPFVETTLDVSVHGFIPPTLPTAPSGGVALGQLVVTTLGPGGTWLAARRASAEETRALGQDLDREARRAAAALQEDGYWGPFCVDAFRFAWRGRSWARCEVNARYSMAWALGMGDDRPDLTCLGAVRGR